MPILGSSFLNLKSLKLMLKWSRLLQRNLMRCLLIKSPLPIEAVWDIPVKVAQVQMCLKRWSLLRPKNWWYQLHLLRMWRLRRNQMWLFKRFWQSLKIQLWPSPRQKGSLFQSHKKVLKLNTFATIVEPEDTLGQIAKNFRHWRMQVLKGQEDKERARGTTSNQKGEK